MQYQMSSAEEQIRVKTKDDVEVSIPIEVLSRAKLISGERLPKN